jgi:hypothetical protein
MGWIANMKARMSLFYADFDENNNYNSILRPPAVEYKRLVKLVDDFLDFIRAIKYP